MKNNDTEFSKEFYYEGDCTGILLIHGFCGNPSEVREIGDYLKDKGFTVKGVLLKGHGCSLKEMRKSCYKDWLASAVAAYKELKQQCDNVIVVGLSMGGAIGFYLARNFDISALISLATPVKVLNKLSVAEAATKLLFRYKNRKEIINDMLTKYNSKVIMGYYKMPAKSVWNLRSLIRYVKKNISYINKPVLIIQSYKDRVVNPVSAGFLYNNIAAEDKSIIYLHESRHLVTCDCEKERVFQEVYDFIIKTKEKVQQQIINKE